MRETAARATRGPDFSSGDGWSEGRPRAGPVDPVCQAPLSGAGPGARWSAGRVAAGAAPDNRPYSPTTQKEHGERERTSAGAAVGGMAGPGASGPGPGAGVAAGPT